MATPKPSSVARPSPSAARSKKSPPTKNLMVTLKLSAQLLSRFPSSVQSIVDIEPVDVKPEPKASSLLDSIAIPVETATTPSIENGSPSNSNTPAPSAADDSSAMPPPSDTAKKDAKKGTKRSSDAAGLLGPKARAKPGPKKKKLDDGTTAPGSTYNAALHKLGPKANQGAINAGLRALDRSGKPCRKWTKGKFELKSFTGAAWGISRWTAPVKIAVIDQAGGSSSGDSTKENKENTHSQAAKSEPTSVSTPDLAATVPLGEPASSPAPMPLAISAN